jgi:hypothetical protein
VAVQASRTNRRPSNRAMIAITSGSRAMVVNVAEKLEQDSARHDCELVGGARGRDLRAFRVLLRGGTEP